MESLSLIDAVMPDVVASRQQQTQNNQKPQVVKTEPPNSNGDEPMHSYRKMVNTFL
jgi:transducin (beta)-like 1